MFTTPCFIRKNTPELREKLEKLGYKYSTTGGIKSNNIVVSLGCIFDIYPIDTIKRGFNNCIDCGENEDLFLALSALRDDNDYMQWFVLDESQQWVNIDMWINVGDIFIVMTEHNQSDWKCHKASVKELIEYFTMEGGAE